MSDIEVAIKITNIFIYPEKTLYCRGLLCNNITHLLLPLSWKKNLGDLEKLGDIFINYNGKKVEGEVFGPVKIQLEKFRPIYNEVVFVDISENKPLIGNLILNQNQLVVNENNILEYGYIS